MRVQGGCHCGRLTYEADVDPEKVGVCHCSDCQMLTGSAFSAFVPVPKEALRMRGEPRMFNLRIGTVRQRAALAPKNQLWCRSALPWVMNLSAVRQHAKQPM